MIKLFLHARRRIFSVEGRVTSEDVLRFQTNDVATVHVKTKAGVLDQVLRACDRTAVWGD